jgi:hypothetical protein
VIPTLARRRVLVGRLGASVDDALLGLVRPIRNEPPVVGVDLVWCLVRDDVEVVARRDVVSGCVPAVRDDLGIEASLEVGLVDEERVPATHTSGSDREIIQRIWK